jgi:Kdo2-lipid IVA lauroyltransferase/acyltransferase
MIAPILFYLFIYPIASLPFALIYRLSDFLYYLIFYIVRYRRKVVFLNLRNSFPKKSETEIQKIAKAFYRHFCDLTVESFKMFSVSEEEIKKRFVFKESRIIHQLYDQKRSVILAGGHYNNWEILAVACHFGIPHKCLALYKPLQNPWFDKKMRESRGRFGLNMWSIKQAKEMFESEKENLTVSIFGVDQSPSNPNSCHWMKFLNQDTGVSFGAEKYAKENNFPVVFGRILKEKRGHYSFEMELVTNDPRNTPTGWIMEEITNRIEADIIKQPEYWLWSHKRWKRKKPDGIQIPSD